MFRIDADAPPESAIVNPAEAARVVRSATVIAGLDPAIHLAPGLMDARLLMPEDGAWRLSSGHHA
jgi:hypothetical protein